MGKNVVHLDNFKFNSLHKYMIPLYSIFNQNRSVSDEEKLRILKGLIPQFFKRMREYRQRTLEDMALGSGLAQIHFIQYEFDGSGTANRRELQDAYIKVCGGADELDYFEFQMRDFKQPGIKESREKIAIDALKRFGVIMPGVDYKNLHSKKGVVLELK
jgi:hypothetical protein